MGRRTRKADTLLEVGKQFVPGVRIIANLICPLLVRSFGSSKTVLSGLLNSVETAEGVSLPMVKHGTACGAATKRLALHIEHSSLSQPLI